MFTLTAPRDRQSPAAFLRGLELFDHAATLPGASAPIANLSRVPARVYAVANQKGGVGKTTTAVNVGACLAEAGERVLLVDLDPQANATSGLGMRANGASTHDLLDGTPLSALVRRTPFPNLDVVMAKNSLAAAAVQLSTREGGERYLAEALGDSLDPYSFVFLDCPPSFGPLTVNALAAAGRTIVPVQAEYYALEGLSQLLGTIRIVQKSLNPGLGIEGVLLTMYDQRLNLARQVQDEAVEYFGEKVYSTVIPRNVRLSEAPSFGQPVILYDILSAGAVSYMKLAEELIERCRPRERG